MCYFAVILSKILMIKLSSSLFSAQSQRTAMATAAWAMIAGAQTGTATTTAVLPMAPSTTRAPAAPAATRAGDAAVECPTTTPTSEKFAADSHLQKNDASAIYLKLILFIRAITDPRKTHFTLLSQCFPKHFPVKYETNHQNMWFAFKKIRGKIELYILEYGCQKVF
jgi:hypothetical protein